MNEELKAKIEAEILRAGGEKAGEDLYRIFTNYGSLKYWGQQFGLVETKASKPRRDRRTQTAWGEYAWFVAVAKAPIKNH